MKKTLLLVLLFCSKLCFALQLGKWTANDIGQLLQNAQTITDEGAKVDYISQHFLNTRYQPHTLIGNADKPEQFTVRLDSVDCMTYIESVEALRRSNSFDDFLSNIKSVRYKDGVVAFQNRNHFFLNWRENNFPYITDVTQQVGDTISRQVTKHLNEPLHKPLIPGIPVMHTLMHYIPGFRIDHKIISRLKNGDYVGLYTDRTGLDVTHVGIIIKKGPQTFFRHASNEPYVNRVIDTEFFDYFKHQRGFVVMRPVAKMVSAMME